MYVPERIRLGKPTCTRIKMPSPKIISPCLPVPILSCESERIGIRVYFAKVRVKVGL